MVGVAQLAERQVVVLDVVGSSPIVHPNVMSQDIGTTPNPGSALCTTHWPSASGGRRGA
jgi:hypothetical protein